MTPIIKIEVETMRQAMHHAFSEQLLNLDEQFKVAIDDATRPEKIQELLTDTANRFIRQAIEDETKSYFLYGEGRKVIAEKVKERLDEEYLGDSKESSANACRLAHADEKLTDQKETP